MTCWDLLYVVLMFRYMINWTSVASWLSGEIVNQKMWMNSHLNLCVIALMMMMIMIAYQIKCGWYIIPRMLLRSNIASIKGHTLWLHFMAMEECGIHLIYASCFKCQRNEEYQQKLCLKGHAINELPIIECPLELDSLCLRECKNLESLPSTICELKSLTTLSCSGCSQLKIFPEILETLENLRELHLDGTAIEVLPASIQHVRGLQYLYLAYCNNLVSLPQTICNLKSLTTLSCPGCSQLKTFPAILETWENLRTAIEELPSSIQHIRGLRYLNLAYCNNLVSLPETICNLSFSKLSLSAFVQNLRIFLRT